MHLLWNALPLRFVRWSKAGVFNHIFETLACESTATGTLMIDRTHLKAHRTAASLLKACPVLDTGRGSVTRHRTQPRRSQLKTSRGLRR